MAVKSKPGNLPFGKYQLIERLGRGGMAEVWKARIAGPGGFSKTLIVKRILPHLCEHPGFVEMFVAEARHSARLDHPAIVQVFELGDVDGEYFLAMEYVRGRDLASVLTAHTLSGTRPPPGLGAAVAREVARALAYAHTLRDDDGRELRLIHRDISPSNIMLSFDGAVKLLDFGIAKALGPTDEAATQTGSLKGKLAYMAPEQVQSGEVDEQTDLFSLGVVLYEALTGTRLFKGSTDAQTIDLVREARVSAPSLVNPEVPPELDRICLKVLAQKPEERYERAADLERELGEVTHELRWGNERIAAHLRTLFGAAPAESVGMPPRAALEEPVNPTPSASAASAGELVPSRSGGGSARGSRRLLYAGSAAALAIAASLLVYLKVARHESAAPATTPAPVAVAHDEAPPTVWIQVGSKPSAAEVFVGAETSPRGRTPLKLSLPRDDQPVQLTLRAAGRASATVEVTPSANSSVDLPLPALPPNAAGARAVKHPPPPRPPPPHPAIVKPKPKSAPDLVGGQTVDPFR
ncbi:MAG TPA: protein kinase [Polyangia bacterium]|nr:protein kinase [Polyangia bacterium]